MQRIIAFTEDELTQLLIRCARMGASEVQTVPEVMTKLEVADYLRVSVASVNRQMKRGLPFVNIGNGSVRFYRSQIDNWLQCPSINDGMESA